jgi:hypothetical protein
MKNFQSKSESANADFEKEKCLFLPQGLQHLVQMLTVALPSTDYEITWRKRLGFRRIQPREACSTHSAGVIFAA